MTEHGAPWVLTFLAPASACNQRCPSCYLSEITHEPVDRFELMPEAYAGFLRELIEEEVPIAGVTFQGYEVTLPSSWPYVEALFTVAKARGIRRSFITNGMLLHKWTDRIVHLDPERISISLDGASAEVNDALRGLPGAFETTLSSVRRFLEAAPHFAKRLAIVSTLYHGANVRSLIDLPALMTELGTTRWSLGVELCLVGEEVRPAHDRIVLGHWLDELHGAAQRAGVTCHVSDEFDFFGDDPNRSWEVDVKTVFDSERIARFDPTGTVRLGREILTEWAVGAGRRWDPPNVSAVQTLSRPPQ